MLLHLCLTSCRTRVLRILLAASPSRIWLSSFSLGSLGRLHRLVVLAPASFANSSNRSLSCMRSSCWPAVPSFSSPCLFVSCRCRLASMLVLAAHSAAFNLECSHPPMVAASPSATLDWPWESPARGSRSHSARRRARACPWACLSGTVLPLPRCAAGVAAQGHYEACGPCYLGIARGARAGGPLAG